MLFPQAHDGLGGGAELRPLAQHVGLPAALHQAPVSLVTVHGDELTATAAGDADVEIATANVAQERLEGFHVIQRRGFGYVATVQQDVDAHPPQPPFLGLHDERLEVIDVGVDVAVGKKTEEVQRGFMLADVVHDLLPGAAFEQLAAFDGLADEGRSLVIDLARANGIMSHLRVTHIVIAGHAHGGTVGLQHRMGILLVEGIQHRGVGIGDRVAPGVGIDTDTVHHDGDNGARYAGEFRVFLQHICLQVLTGLENRAPFYRQDLSLVAFSRNRFQ